MVWADRAFVVPAGLPWSANAAFGFDFSRPPGRAPKSLVPTTELGPTSAGAEQQQVAAILHPCLVHDVSDMGGGGGGSDGEGGGQL